MWFSLAASLFVSFTSPRSPPPPPPPPPSETSVRLLRSSIEHCGRSRIYCCVAPWFVSVCVCMSGGCTCVCGPTFLWNEQQRDNEANIWGEQFLSDTNTCASFLYFFHTYFFIFWTFPTPLPSSPSHYRFSILSLDFAKHLVCAIPRRWILEQTRHGRKGHV